MFGIEASTFPGGSGGLLHFGFEALAYAVAAALYIHGRRREGDALPDAERLSLVVAAAVGAALGSRVLFWLCDPRWTAAHATDVSAMLGGKTIVGALLGGLIAVELRKRSTGIEVPTGDLYVLPLCSGIAIGRIGCFLAGPADLTAGRPTNLPWAVAMGDSIPRHPTALYEIAFILALAVVLRRLLRSGRAPAGLAFALFHSSYLAFRLAIDFLKPFPPPLPLGLSAIQLACIAGLGYYAAVLPDRFRGHPQRVRSREQREERL